MRFGFGVWGSGVGNSVGIGMKQSEPWGHSPRLLDPGCIDSRSRHSGEPHQRKQRPRNALTLNPEPSSPQPEWSLRPWALAKIPNIRFRGLGSGSFSLEPREGFRA